MGRAIAMNLFRSVQVGIISSLCFLLMFLFDLMVIGVKETSRTPVLSKPTNRPKKEHFKSDDLIKEAVEGTFKHPIYL